MALVQPTITLTVVTKTTIAKGGALTFKMPPSTTTADLDHTQTANLQVYSRLFTGLAVDVSQPLSVSVVWPADAPYTLPPGEYNVEFRTSVPVGISEAYQLDFQADAATVIPAVTLPNLAAAYNALVAEYNGLLLNLRTSGIMAQEDD